MCIGVLSCVEDVHVLRKELNFEVDSQWGNGRPKRTWEYWDDESMKIGLNN